MFVIINILSTIEANIDSELAEYTYMLNVFS